MDRIKLGTKVLVSHQPDRDRLYYEEHRNARRVYDGLAGVVIAEHDSHGLCYEVKFPMNPTLVTYDREELQEVQ